MATIIKRGVVFDMDGTLTSKRPSLWSAIDKNALSKRCHRKLAKLRKRYLASALDGTLSKDEEMDWLIQTLNAYIEDGLSEEKLRYAVQNVVLRKGVLDCLDMLERNNIPTAIVSYGVWQAIESTLQGNGLNLHHSLFGSIFAVKFITDPTKNDVKQPFTGYDPESMVIPSNKNEWSKRFAEKHGISPKSLLAVGDSGGDRVLAPLKPNRFGLAGDREEAEMLRKFMGTVAISRDFNPATEWLKKRLKIK